MVGTVRLSSVYQLPPGLTQQGGPLQSYWWGVLPLAAAVVLVGWWLRRGRAAGRAGLGSLAVAALGTALSATGALGVANAYAGYVPDLTAAARLLGLPNPAAGDLPLWRETADVAGTVFTAAVADPRGRIPASPVWVYTPPGYGRSGNNTRYPVVYLLHGYPGRSTDWFAAGAIDTVMNELIKARVMPPVIVVAPDMNGGGLRDTEGLNVSGGPQIAAYLTRTVPAWADAHLRTVPDPGHRVIGGMSAGGYAALNLGLRHQGTFGGIIALEPYGDPGGAGLASLGGDHAQLAANSPSVYLPTIALSRAQAVFIDVGGAGATGATAHLAGQVRDRGLAVQYRVEAGMRHTWREARAGIPYGMLFVAHQLHWPIGPHLPVGPETQQGR